MEFSLNYFTEFAQLSDKKYLLLKRLKLATSCVRYQDATTAPASHMWKTGSLNSAQFILQWFIRLSEFTDITKFNECSPTFMKNSIVNINVTFDVFNIMCKQHLWNAMKPLLKVINKFEFESTRKQGFISCVLHVNEIVAHDFNILTKSRDC